MSLRLSLSSTAVAGLAALAAGAAQAEPNITGMWALSQPEGRLHAGPPPMIPAVRAANQARQKIDQANHRLIGEAHTKCLPAGMPGLMQPPFGIEFLQTKGRVTILSEVSNLPRTIYLDEKIHPDTMIPGWNGHSIGHWEGDTLVVDTIGFNGRQPNVSEKMHITERIHLTEAGKYLVDDLTLDDPATYTEPYHISYRYKRAEGQEASELMEYVCEVDPANLFAFESEMKAAGLPSDMDSSWTVEAFNHPAPKGEDAPKPVAAK